ncbi:MAG: hypothetical protein K2H76_06805, partial [Muribaculaceae bacterium]|nr:hypothetical protein [Muribaculaceae bacterium]
MSKQPLHIRLRPMLLTLAFLCGVSTLLARPGDKILNRPYADQKMWHLGFSVGTHFQDLDFTHNGFTTPEGG